MERCKKSSGLHWDIVLLCILNVPAALFGGPWMCVAQIRAVTQLSALTVMSTNHAPGETPKVVDVKGIKNTKLVDEQSTVFVKPRINRKRQIYSQKYFPKERVNRLYYCFFINLSESTTVLNDTPKNHHF